MPRRRRLRKVVAPPGFKSFKPYGNKKSGQSAVELFYEEYEAIKLADFDSMSQLEASLLMGVSRPTFARIYATARQKIAKALVESREITAIFGHAILDKDWHLCNKCHSKFSIPKDADHNHCPLCQSDNFQSINPDI